MSLMISYLQNEICYSCLRVVLKVIKEMALLEVTRVFLEIMSRQLVRSHHPLAIRYVRNLIVYSPIAEEMLFRWIMLGGIYRCQQVWNRYIKQQELTEEELKKQQWVRIHLTSIVFGLMHATNSDEPVKQALNCSVSYIQGVHYAWLQERFGTLSIPVMAHGLTNSLALLVQNQSLSFFTIYR